VILHIWQKYFYRTIIFNTAIHPVLTTTLTLPIKQLKQERILRFRYIDKKTINDFVYKFITPKSRKY